MSIGIILQSNAPEHIWNAFRFGITALTAGHRVTMFLINEGSEFASISNAREFDISKKIAEYTERKGTLYACGTRVALRGKTEAGACRLSTMEDLLAMVEENDKLLTF